MNLALNTPIGSLLGPRDTTVLTINDDDLAGAFRFSAAAYSVNEGAGPATVTVTRSRGTASGVTVNYAIADGTTHDPADYSGSGSHPLLFGAGATTRTFTVPVVNNALVQSDRTVGVVRDGEPPRALSVLGRLAELGRLDGTDVAACRLGACHASLVRALAR